MLQTIAIVPANLRSILPKLYYTYTESVCHACQLVIYYVKE